MNANVMAITLFSGVIAALAVQRDLPAEHWFHVPEHGVRVLDAAAGECPIVELTREIRQPFHGEWTVTMMRRQRNEWATWDTFLGENDYRPGNALPDPLTLAWIVDAPPTTARQWCASVPEGEWRLHVLWRIEAPVGPPREVRRTSNPFKIRAED